MAEAKVKDNKNKKPVRIIPDQADPTDFGNIHLSKAQFIAKEIARKERDIKVKAYAESLKAEAEKKVDAREEEIKTEQKNKAEVKEIKPKGRPKKID